MANQLQQFKAWLLEKRFFRIARFAKDPKYAPAPEEALAELPDEVAKELINAANKLPVSPREESLLLEGLGKAIAQWKEQPEVSPNSIVILADPVSSVSRILTNCLIKLEQQHHNGEPLPINLLDWIERPADDKSIKQQIKDRLGFDAEAEDSQEYLLSQEKRSHTELSIPNDSANRSDLEDLEESANRTGNKLIDSSENPKQTQQKELVVVPNLCWCFLRSVSGLEGLDYVQDLLPSNHGRFWVMGSGIVGWEYLKSTLKFHAYCGEVFRIPALSGEDLQKWLSPLVDQFDIYFLDNTIQKRLQNIDSLFDLDISVDKPMAALSEITQEVSATVQSSVNAMKDELLESDEELRSHSPERQYFQRLAEVSDGVSTVALQLFIKSLRYREVELEREKPEPEKENTEGADVDDTQRKVLIKEGDSYKDKSTQRSAIQSAKKDVSSHPKSIPLATHAKAGMYTERRMIATTPKLPPLPELSQSDLYLLYSLMLHGDLTISSLAESLGDAPNVVNNQVQMLRNEGVIEQQGNVLKANPAHYPQLRRELDRNNFIIEVPH